MIKKEFNNRLFKKLGKFLVSKIDETLHTTQYVMTQWKGCRCYKRLDIDAPLQMLQTLEETCKSQWKDKFRKLMFVYNCTKHSVTDYSRLYVLFDKGQQLPVDIYTIKFTISKGQ